MISMCPFPGLGEGGPSACDKIGKLQLRVIQPGSTPQCQSRLCPTTRTCEESISGLKSKVSPIPHCQVVVCHALMPTELQLQRGACWWQKTVANPVFTQVEKRPTSPLSKRLVGPKVRSVC